MFFLFNQRKSYCRPFRCALLTISLVQGNTPLTGSFELHLFIQWSLKAKMALKKWTYKRASILQPSQSSHSQMIKIWKHSDQLTFPTVAVSHDHVLLPCMNYLHFNSPHPPISLFLCPFGCPCIEWTLYSISLTFLAFAPNWPLLLSLVCFFSPWLPPLLAP